MPTIDSLVKELNELSKFYIAHKLKFNGHESISEIFKVIEDQNYNLALPEFEINRPEYKLLSDDGKMDFEKILAIRKLKVEATRNKKNELLAVLCERERLIEKQIRLDLFINTGKQYFYLINNLYKTVIVNDPKGHLKGMFGSRFKT
jgi:hypothetical protein